MAPLIHLDTDVLAWLYLADVDLLSATARELIERDELAMSPMAVLELTCLHEVGRLRVDVRRALPSLPLATLVGALVAVQAAQAGAPPEVGLVGRPRRRGGDRPPRR